MNGQTTAEFKFLTNIGVNRKVYSVNVQFPENNFRLQICDLDGTCKNTINYGFSIDTTLFKQSIVDFFKTKIDTSLVSSTFSSTEIEHITRIPSKAKKYFDSLKSEREQITRAIDNPEQEFSGRLKLNKKIPILSTTFDNNRLLKYDTINNKTKGQKKAKARQQKKEKDSLTSHKENSTKLDTFLVKKAYLNFFNNKVSTVVIEGDVYLKEKLIKENVVVNNRSFSIPVRYFNMPGNRLYFRFMEKKFVLEIDDIFDYNSDEHFNYSLANQELILKLDETTKKVEQRRFIDYFTGIFYSDLLGFNGENTNSLVNAQARILIPLSQRNFSPGGKRNAGKWYGKYSLFRQITTTLNMGLYNNSDEESRLVSSVNSSKFELSDIYRKRNINSNIGMDVLSYEAKGFSTTISAGYQASYFRTKFKSKITKPDPNSNGTNLDEEKTGQLYSISHGPYLNFEIRPQTNFGADIRLQLDNFSYNGTDNVAGLDVKPLILNKGINHALFKHNIINLQADFYWIAKGSKANGGVYASIGGAYFTKGSIFAPQLLVGYATNLTSFVNRFKKQKPTVKTP